jgi:hypothetical protein
LNASTKITVSWKLDNIAYIMKVNITEGMTPVQRQDVITRDKAFMGVYAVQSSYRIKTYIILREGVTILRCNYESQIDTLVRTILRDIIVALT